jgi:DNA-binding GntR family transcriptional regulator
MKDASLPGSERVYAALRDQILSGTLAPNQRLVELQLASQFGLSRTPIREALKRLAAEGLVSLDPVRGMVVRHVDATEVEDIYAIREVLDGLAARLAAHNATDADIEKLRLLSELMEESARTGQWEAVVQINIRFHGVLYSASRNERLELMAKSLQDAVRRYSSMAFYHTERVVEVLREHNEIIAALQARDAERAEHASRGHMSRARANLSELLSTGPEQSAPELLNGK